METKITKIGNSRGIIIPAQVLRACGIEESVVLDVHDNHLVISAPYRPRGDWEERFENAATDKNTDLMTMPNRFDTDEWSW